jgi:hypothetical protein
MMLVYITHQSIVERRTYQAATQVSTTKDKVEAEHGSRPWRSLLTLDIVRELHSKASVLDLVQMIDRSGLLLVGDVHDG